MNYVWAFVVGGLFCVVAQVMIDKTRLTPARILVSYVVAGVILGALGLYKPLVEFAGAGATTPLTGFGYLISKGVVKAAIKNPRNIDMNLVDAQQARRILDRIVGYKISPLLWKNVKNGLSAGRTQSVAARIICEREE